MVEVDGVALDIDLVVYVVYCEEVSRTFFLIMGEYDVWD